MNHEKESFDRDVYKRQVLKHAVTKLPNNWIPALLVIIGVIVNSWIEAWTFTPEILIGGIASGLLSVGLFETAKTLIDRVKNTFSTKEDVYKRQVYRRSSQAVWRYQRQRIL